MPINKSALIRYKILDKCLANSGRLYTLDELKEKVEISLKEIDTKRDGISPRTLYYDLNFMMSEEGYSAPIIKKKNDRGKMCYTYEDKGYSIFKAPLKSFELMMLKDLAQLIEIFDGKPQLDYWQEALLHWKEDLRLLHSNNTPLVRFSDNPYLKNRALLQVLYRYVIDRQPILIHYLSFKDPAATFVLHPYLLKEYNNRWYIFGFHADLGYIYNPAIDRIQHVEPASVDFLPPPESWEEDFFDDIIGVTRYQEKSLLKIHLLASPTAAPYILTKPLHGSQKSYMRPDGYHDIHLCVYPNMELDNHILSFGEQIVVVAPLDYRDHIRDRLNKARSLYI